MENKIIIWTWNFWYFKYSLWEVLDYLKQFNGFNWVEISVKHWYKFDNSELRNMKKYKYNVVHLWWLKKDDLDWMQYCINTIPNFQHFTLHPNTTDFDVIDKDIEWYLSFENMDINKSSYKTPCEMSDLFKIFPDSWFTFDINHAEENSIPYHSFDIVKFPNKIHFSVLNKWFYSNFKWIITTHSLACFKKWFEFDLVKYKKCIITIEWVFVPWRTELIQKEIDLVGLLLEKPHI